MKFLKAICAVLLFLTSCAKQVPEKETIEEEIIVVSTPEPTPEITLEPERIIEFVDTQRSEFSSVFSMSSDSVNYSREVSDGNHDITISDWSDGQAEVILSCYGLVLEKNDKFKVSFETESDVAASVTVQISSYDDIYHEKTYSVSNGTIEDSFTVSMPSFYDGKLKLIFNRSDEATSGTIQIRNINVSSSGNVKVNQVGYLPVSSKIAVFSYNAGDTFEVIDVKSNEVAYRGEIVGAVENEAAMEKNYLGDFSALTKEGVYKIVTNFNHESTQFEIRNNLYASLLKDSLIALSSQRCGQTLTEDVYGPLAHEACHHTLADVEVNDTMIDVIGGWHDAGDYGRYVCPGVKAVSDLLIAYLLYPEVFGDDMGIMESGNGVSDLLDEARVELEWLLKMQRTDSNAFFNSVITEVFAPMVSPEDDHMQLYALKQENTATAAASAALALGSIVFKTIDPIFSETCLESAKRGFAHAEWQRGSEDIKNPEKFSGGDYANASDYDELYYAAMALYAATFDEKYLLEAETLVESCNKFDFTYDSFGGYGTVLYLLYGEDSEYLRRLKQEFAESCQTIVDRSNQDGYLTASSRVYSWSGNMHIANSAMQLLIGYHLFKDEILLKTVQHQLDYILGKNALNLSFITGYGKNSVNNLHNRLTISHSAMLNGFLAAGIDKNLENSILKELISKETPEAKRFIDHNQSYSNTEVAIYQNSVFIFVLGGLNSQE